MTLGAAHACTFPCAPHLYTRTLRPAHPPPYLWQDGLLTKEEVLFHFKQQGQASIPQGLWEWKDANGDGHITWDEFDPAQNPPGGKPKPAEETKEDVKKEETKEEKKAREKKEKQEKKEKEKKEKEEKKEEQQQQQQQQ